MNIRIRAGLVVLTAFSVLLAVTAAACGSATNAGTPQPSERYIGQSGSPGTQPGSASIAVTGARSVAIDTVGTCSSHDGVLAAILRNTDPQTVYTLTLGADSVSGPGAIPVGKDRTTVVELADTVGNAWDGTQTGASGKLTLDPGLRSGSVDATLVNPADKTTVRVQGTWSCGG